MKKLYPLEKFKTKENFEQYPEIYAGEQVVNELKQIKLGLQLQN